MPNGDEITAQAADGTKHVFPSGTDPIVIDKAMKQYVLGKAQTQVDKYPIAAPDSTATQIGRGGALGAAEGMGIQPGQTGMEVIKNTLANFLKSISGQGKESFGNWRGGLEKELGGSSSAWDPRSQISTLGAAAMTPLDMLAGMIDKSATGLENTGKEAYRSYKNKDIEGTSHAVGSGLGQLFSLRALREGDKPTQLDPTGKLNLSKMGREVVNEGQSKINVLNDLHSHAIETQKHIAGVADAVHTDAQQAMAGVSQAVDSAKPEGVFDKGEIGSRLKTAIGDTVSDTSQLPKSLQKLIPSEKAGPQPGPNIGGKVLDLSKPEEMATYQKYKASGAFTPEEVAKYEGKSTGKMSFEDLKQARSDLGKQMQNLEGPAKAAASAAYSELSKALREGARDAGKESDWIDANARWKNYLDDFYRSPLAKTLEGENAHDIMDPLTGKSRVQVGQILQKYTPFGLDVDKVGQEVSRYGMGDTVMKLSRPGKMDLLLARLSPTAVALRQIGPRIMRNPSVISAVAGEGFEPKNIPPSKIFPSQKIAAKAASGGMPQGNPTPFKSGINAAGVEASTRPNSVARIIDSLSNEIDTMKTRLRNAGDAPAAEKTALEKQIDEYQQRLDDLRKK